MKTSYLFKHSNYLIFRTAIAREQKQFIKIAFAVHLSAAISAERYRSDSGALKSAVLNFVFFILIKNKIEQSACQSCLKNNLLEVFPLTVGSGKTMAFENRWSRYKEIGKKVPQAYRVYVEDTFLPCDAGDARIFSKEHEHGLRVSKHIFVGNSRLVTAMTHADNNGDTTEQTEKRYYYQADHLQSAQFITNARGEQYEHIEYTPYGELWIEETAPGIDKLPFRFTGKELDEETGLYYYGARYLDPKYSRWLSGDPALNDYMAGSSVGEGGIYNTVNFNVYHYGGNNPIKYVDPNGMWDAKNEWNTEFQKKYEDYIPLKISEYEKNKKRFTCEDLALSILIDFASENSLPLNIKNNSGTYNSSDDKYSNPEKYKKDVLSSTAANDLMQNTVAVDKTNISSGDLVLMDTGTPNGTKDNEMSHTQVVTKNEKGVLTIKQGNFSSGSSKYGSLFYGGVNIQSRTLDTNKDIFISASGSKIPNASNAFGINYRRWNFGAWKK
ncbi:RHS repeat-associated core domain-containing protein [Treponema denticola]